MINPLLINGFSKRSLRKTKTDKKDALTIAQFLMREEEALPVKTPDYLITELKELARRREKLADHMTSIKGDMKRILSVTFPELENLTRVFTKAILRLLMQYPSARAIRNADSSAIADVFNKGRGNRPRITVKALIEAATSSVGVASAAKELTLGQEVSLLMYVEE